MLLSCCFRDPKEKKCKASKDGLGESEYQKQDGAKTGDSQCLLASPRDPPPQIQASVHTSDHIATLSPATLSPNPRHVTMLSSSPRHVATVYTSTPNPRHQQAWQQGPPLDLKLSQKERYPLTKEARRLQKQRSQDSVSRILAEGTATHRLSIPYIDQSPIDPALPRPPSVPRDTLPHLPPPPQQPPSPPPEKTISPPPPLETHLSSPPRQLARKGPKITAYSVPNLSGKQLKRNSLTNEQVEKSVSVGQVEKLSNHGLQQNQTILCSPSRSEESSPSHSEALEFISCQDEYNIEKEVFVSKMLRSTASYGIKDLLQEQIKKEEQEKSQREQEEIITKSIKMEYEDLLEKINTEHKRILENVQSQYEHQLSEKTESHQKDLEKVVMKSKNELNALIIKHGKELEMAKKQMETVKSERDTQRDVEISKKEAEWACVKQELEDRDRIWQEEKQEVLAEVQRLKAEAGRMVAILAMEVEEEEEMLSEDRKRTLQHEVESLKMVVEMKTTDVKLLKTRQDDMGKHLKELEITKNELTKMRAKVEDLQSLLDQKNDNEKKLSMEKSKLEAWMETESRTSARKSLEVEQLQWRIRHNMDLPPVLVHKSMSCPPQDLSPNGVDQWNSGAKERPQSAPTSGRIQEDGHSSMNGFSDVKKEYENGGEIIDKDMHHSCSTQPWKSSDPCQSCLSQMDLENSQYKRCEIVYDNMSTVRESVSHFERMITSESRKTSIIDVEEKIDVIRKESDATETETVTSYDMFSGAVDDASDEGLGDISSENDSGSPQPNEDNKVDKNFSVEKQLEIVNCAKNIDKNEQFSDLRDNKDNNNKQIERKMSSPTDDRLPSRMPFETPL